jgi:hypothetical protein
MLRLTRLPLRCAYEPAVIAPVLPIFMFLFFALDERKKEKH